MIQMTSTGSSIIAVMLMRRNGFRFCFPMRIFSWRDAMAPLRKSQSTSCLPDVSLNRRQLKMESGGSGKKQTEEFKLYGRLRNGVETIPSLLKNRYGVNRMPVHGKIRCKFFFGCKVAALNFRKLFRFRQGSGKYALNPAVG